MIFTNKLITESEKRFGNLEKKYYSQKQLFWTPDLKIMDFILQFIFINIIHYY